MERTKKEQEIVDGLKPVCVCKGIKQRTIIDRIRAGMTTVRELQQATGAGSGSCKGERCTPRIVELLNKECGHGKATTNGGLAQSRQAAKESKASQNK